MSRPRRRTKAPYELGTLSLAFNFALYPVYVRGEAYLAAHQGPAAVAEFQKILDHSGVVLNQLISVLAHLQLGRASPATRPGPKPPTRTFLRCGKMLTPTSRFCEKSRGSMASSSNAECSQRIEGFIICDKHGVPEVIH